MLTVGVTMEEKNIDKRPPIGVVPKRTWDTRRWVELSQAIVRYAEAERIIPIEWVEEYNLLLKIT